MELGCGPSISVWRSSDCSWSLMEEFGPFLKNITWLKSSTSLLMILLLATFLAEALPVIRWGGRGKLTSHWERVCVVLVYLAWYSAVFRIQLIDIHSLVHVVVLLLPKQPHVASLFPFFHWLFFCLFSFHYLRLNWLVEESLKVFYVIL